MFSRLNRKRNGSGKKLKQNIQCCAIIIIFKTKTMLKSTEYL